MREFEIVQEVVAETETWSVRPIASSGGSRGLPAGSSRATGRTTNAVANRVAGADPGVGCAPVARIILQGRPPSPDPHPPRAPGAPNANVAPAAHLPMPHAADPGSDFPPSFIPMRRYPRW